MTFRPPSSLPAVHCSTALAQIIFHARNAHQHFWISRSRHLGHLSIKLYVGGCALVPMPQYWHKNLHKSSQIRTNLTMQIKFHKNYLILTPNLLRCNQEVCTNACWGMGFEILSDQVFVENCIPCQQSIVFQLSTIVFLVINQLYFKCHHHYEVAIRYLHYSCKHITFYHN